jgi:hypothetical protein
MLGRVDGFYQDEDAGERDEGGVVLLGLLASHGDPLEALDLADELLDAGAQPVEALGKEAWLGAGVAAMGDDRADAAAACGVAIGLRVVALIGDYPTRGYVRAKIQERFELPAVARLVAGQVEVERTAGEVAFEVDLGAKATTRTAERLLLLPPFAPAAETWARIEVLSNICTTPAVRLHSASA